jgi:nephrocystin-4
MHRIGFDLASVHGLPPSFHLGMQVGTASVDLQPLLRQGRDFAELLVEVPILDQAAVAPSLQGQTFMEAAYNQNTGAC